MEFFQIGILSVVQGITEFLPISSSAHLILVPSLFGWPDQGIGMDIAVHVGTLLAVMTFFWRDTRGLCIGLWQSLTGQWRQSNAQLFLKIAVGTVPILVVGFAVKDSIANFRSPMLIGCTSIIFGIVLWLVDRRGAEDGSIETLPFWQVALVGVAQVLALVPGVSRSGITMTAGRMFGLNRLESARLSLLLGIPTIAAAGSLLGLEIVKALMGRVTDADSSFADLNLFAVGTAIILTFGFALLTLAVFMKWLKTSDFTPFVIYRTHLGAFLIGWALAHS